MAKITTTKSGLYTTQVFIGRDLNGKRITKRITAKTKRELKMLEAKLKTSRTDPTYSSLTLGEAYDRYISSKANVISPSTLREYRRAADRDFPLLLPLPLSQLTNEIVQTAVNEIAAVNSPKTVRNKYYLLESVLKAYAPDLRLNVRLPQKIKCNPYIPTEDEVLRLINAADDFIRVPVLLASMGGLRRSEIAALTPADFSDTGVVIDKAKVRGENGYDIKPPKTAAGYRFSPLSRDVIREALAWKYFGTTPEKIEKRFHALAQSVGVPVTFHKLRHFYCTELLTQGFDPKTICLYGGWESVAMVFEIYGHAMQSRETDQKVVNIFEAVKKPVTVFESQHAVNTATKKLSV